MTEKEICELQHENDNTELYLQLSGMFWRAFDGGAFALARVTGYKVIRRKSGRPMLGFPQSALDWVLAETGSKGISWQRTADGLYTFTGGNPAEDPSLIAAPSASVSRKDTTADYRALCELRRQLLGINLVAIDAMTLQKAVRDLQISCLSMLV